MLPNVLSLIVCASIATLAAVDRQSADQCAPVAGADRLLQPGRIALIGELHGTVESPSFVRDVICLALDAGLPVTLALEFPASDTERTEAFLQSAGGAGDRRALVSGGRWAGEPQYGLTSESMLDLLDQARRWRRKAQGVNVTLFDRPGSATSSRDRAMAGALRDVAKTSRRRLLLVLTGNFHSRVVGGNPDREPMGSSLSRMIDSERVLALDVAHTGGTAWVCVASGGCGAQPMRPRGPEGTGITWTDEPIRTGHHGWYHVGSLHASAPARDAP